MIDLEQLLKIALNNLDQIDKYDEYIAYLHSEWYYSSHDLLLAKENSQLWSSLCLPGRLKIELMNLINNDIIDEDIQIDTIDIADNNIHCMNVNNDPQPSENHWICCISNEYDCYYYYNTLTQESIWEFPSSLHEGFTFTEVFEYSEEIQQWIITSQFDHNKIYPSNQHYSAYTDDDTIQICNNDNGNNDTVDNNTNANTNNYQQTGVAIVDTNTPPKGSIRPRTVIPVSRLIVDERANTSIYSTDEEKEELSPPAIINKVHVSDYNSRSIYRNRSIASNKIPQQSVASSTVSGGSNVYSKNYIKNDYECYGEGGWVYSVADSSSRSSDQIGIFDNYYEEESNTSYGQGNKTIQSFESGNIDDNLYCTSSSTVMHGNNSQRYTDNAFHPSIISNTYNDNKVSMDNYYGYSNEGSYGTYLEYNEPPPSAPCINELDSSDPYYITLTTSTTTTVAQPITDDYVEDNYIVVEASSPSRLLMYDESDDLIELAMMESPLEGNVASRTPHNVTGIDSNYHNTNSAIPKRKKIGKLFRMNLFGRNITPKIPLTPPATTATTLSSTGISPINSNFIKSSSSGSSITKSNKINNTFKVNPSTNNINFTTTASSKDCTIINKFNDIDVYNSKKSNKFESQKRDGQLSRIQRLMDIGFKEKEAIIALELCNDHLEDATNMLIENHKAINLSRK